MSDIFGYLAAISVLISASSSNMRRLRGAALISNLCFITYAVFEELAPVLFLHALLLPVNLLQVWRCCHTTAGKSFDKAARPQI